VCAACETVCCGNGGVSVCCVLDILLLVWGEGVSAVCGTVYCGFRGVSFCCVVQFVVGMGE